MVTRTTAELLDAYMDQENLHRSEGEAGVENLCQIAAVLGYKDPMYFGQLSQKAVIGDLLEMLKDNPGMIVAMIEWIRQSKSPEFCTALEAAVGAETAIDHYGDETCPNCGEDISPESVLGDECPNCGYVYCKEGEDDPEWNNSDGHGA